MRLSQGQGLRNLVQGNDLETEMMDLHSRGKILFIYPFAHSAWVLFPFFFPLLFPCSLF